MKVKNAFRITFIIGFLAPFCYSFSQNGDKVKIKITKNDVVIVDTVITENMSTADIDNLVTSLSGEEKEDSADNKNIEVKVIKTGDLSELDSLLRIDGNSKNIEIIVNDNQNGTKIERNNKTVNYEIKISKGEDKEEGEVNVVIEKDISKD